MGVLVSIALLVLGAWMIAEGEKRKDYVIVLVGVAALLAAVALSKVATFVVFGVVGVVLLVSILDLLANVKGGSK